jgi:hypothetical protein
VVFWLGTQVLEDALFPIPLHVVPILNHAVPNRIMDPVCLRVRHRFITDVKVEIFDTTL